MTEIDHEQTHNIVCPYCGSEDCDSWEVSPGEEDLGLIDCDCGKSFYAIRNITITYSTDKANYGTRKHCGSEDVPIENYSSSFGEYKELCAECGYKEKQRLIEDNNLIEQETELVTRLQNEKGKE